MQFKKCKTRERSKKMSLFNFQNKNGSNKALILPGKPDIVAESKSQKTFHDLGEHDISRSSYTVYKYLTKEGDDWKSPFQGQAYQLGHLYQDDKLGIYAYSSLQEALEARTSFGPTDHLFICRAAHNVESPYSSFGCISQNNAFHQIKINTQEVDSKYVLERLSVLKWAIVESYISGNKLLFSGVLHFINSQTKNIDFDKVDSLLRQIIIIPESPDTKLQAATDLAIQNGDTQDISRTMSNEKAWYELQAVRKDSRGD